jgi:hypothetical protein
MPRQPKTVSVHRGNLTGQGVNKPAAKADLEAQIDWLLDQPGAAVEVRFGHVIIVTANPAAAAHEYTIIWPEDLAHHGKTKAATVCVGRLDRGQAIQAARSHVAQAAWNPACNDDQFLGRTGLDDRRCRDLADWIGWQRRYQTFKSAGKSDREAFDLASGRPTISKSEDAESPSTARLPMMKR